MNLHMHKYSEWSDPVETYTGYVQQWKVCSVCNKAKFRNLRWHKMTNIANIRSAINQVKGK